MLMIADALLDFPGGSSVNATVARSGINKKARADENMMRFSMIEI